MQYMTTSDLRTTLSETKSTLAAIYAAGQKSDAVVGLLELRDAVVEELSFRKYVGR